MSQTTIDLTVDQITKIEGHASLHLKVDAGEIKECHFSIPEYKRFYTQAVRGKKINAIPQMVARICGTCSNAHLLCSIDAIEAALAITPSAQTRLLRRLLINGLIIRDHALHLYVFVLPDLLGRDSLLDFDETKPEEMMLVQDAFAIKEAGNQLAIWVGGRSVHAPTPAIGGFLKMPDITKTEELILKLELIRQRVVRIIRIFEKDTSRLEEQISFSALQSPQYDFMGDTIITGEGEHIPAEQYGAHLEHVIIPYSQASAYTFQGKVYLVGALARMNLSRDRLHEKTKQDAGTACAVFPSKNIFHNNLAQAIEILHCLDDSIDVLSHLTLAEEKQAPLTMKAGTGIGVIEAPRGTLYHRYEIDEQGTVTNGTIIVPTGQNQISIEKSLRDYAQNHLDDPQDQLAHAFETIIRAYDPCMSCASHFLTLQIERCSS